MFTNDEFIKKGYSVIDNVGRKALALVDPETGHVTNITDQGTKGTAVRFLSDTYTEIDYNGEGGKTYQVKGKSFQVTSRIYTKYVYSYGSERPYGAVDLIGEDGMVIAGVPVNELELIL